MKLDPLRKGQPPQTKPSWPPTFVREVATEPFRAKLLTGVVTGYGTAFVLLAVTLGVQWYGSFPEGELALILISIKLATNTLAAIAWRTRRLLLPLSALNITADVLLLTGAIYVTGGVLSPLVALYFIEVAAMALLTNVGLTVTVVVACFIAYAAMVLAVQLGMVPATEPLAGSSAEVTNVLVLAMLALTAVSTLGPGLYVSLIVERLRRSEKALEARAADLVAASRTKSEFTTNITHELRTPLHGIMGMGELLEEGVYGSINPKQIEAVQTIRRSAGGLLELIDSLLVLARAEALKLEVAVAPVDIGEVVSSVVATGRMVVGNRGLSLAADIAPELPLVTTDRQKLVQILVNLLANAIKFTPDEGAVRIEARRDPGGVSIVVKDTGTGISKEALPHIFEPYVQADGSPIREHGGAGIGLSVVRTLADLLAIGIDVESEPGLGSTFTLRLPLAAPRPLMKCPS